MARRRAEQDLTQLQSAVRQVCSGTQKLPFKLECRAALLTSAGYLQIAALPLRAPYGSSMHCCTHWNRWWDAQKCIEDDVGCLVVVVVFFTRTAHLWNKIVGFTLRRCLCHFPVDQLHKFKLESTFSSYWAPGYRDFLLIRCAYKYTWGIYVCKYVL